jgi:phosphatidylinositol-3-phosphatase
MTPRLKGISLFQRRRRVAGVMQRGRLAVSAIGLMVVVVGCAQASSALTAGAISAIGAAGSDFGHPKLRHDAGQISPTPGSTPIPAIPGTAARPLGATGPFPTPSATSRPGPTPTARPTPTPNPTPNPTPPPSSAPHVLLVMEENKGYAAVLSGAPYLDSLAHSYLSSSAWYGINHPSAPNYVGFVSGSIQNVVGDCTPPSCGPYAAPSLGGQLTAAGIPWAAYMESMPSPCYTGSKAGLYAEKHNPFMYFNDVLQNNCASHVLPYPGVTSLLSTLDGSRAPDFVWITPNLLNDMHDGSVLQGDAWARANIAPILASSWFRNYNATVIVTMDEGDANGSASCCGQSAGGQVPMIVISNRAAGKGSVVITGDHYGALRSLEEVYRLRLLGAAANAVNGDLSSYFG